jgi:hypothetical protein
VWLHEQQRCGSSLEWRGVCTGGTGVMMVC